MFCHKLDTLRKAACLCLVAFHYALIRHNNRYINKKNNEVLRLDPFLRDLQLPKIKLLQMYINK